MAARIVLVALLMVGLHSNYLTFITIIFYLYFSNMWIMRVLAMVVISVRRGKTTP